MLFGAGRRWNLSAWHVALVLALASWACTFCLTIVGPTWQVDFATLTAAAVAAAAFAAQRQSKLRHAEMRQFIESLCRDDLDQIDDESSAPAATLSLDPQWSGLLSRLRDHLVDLSRRARDAEHARAGAEVRTRRAVAERDQVRDILAASPDPVIVIDPYDAITFANPAAERIFGLQFREERYGTATATLSQEAFRTVLSETRKRNSIAGRAATFTFRDGAGYDWDLRASCRVLAAGSPASAEGRHQHSVVASFNDISALKALQKRNAEFVSSASHEMKAPLAGINAYVELLVDGDAEDEATRNEFLGVIKSQAERLQRLVENLLNLARIEAGVVKVNKRAQSLNEVLQEAYNVLSPTAEMKNIRLSCDLSSMYLGVFGDHDTLLQAAINLGSNAIKYTPPGGKVTIRSGLAEQCVSFEFTDTGVGLSKEDCAKVFEKFYRVKKDSTMAPGTGLGLALVKHIVEDVHGGRIEVESELEKGSTFRVTLPASEHIKQ
jgi:two-component system phosphate regulon sensor histidine kinase PhoR